MKIEKLRKDTSGVEKIIHFNNAGASLPPQIVTNTILEYLTKEAQNGGYEWRNHKVKAIEGFYSALANMLNCLPRNIAFTTNATDSYNRALLSIPFEKGDTILTTIDDYASNQIAFIQLQQRLGVRFVRAANLPEGGVDLVSMKTLMEKHRPKLVAVTHIPTNSGLVQPVAAIGQLCKEREILYLVDACQSVGQLPLDVEKMHCDFLSATGRKFLRGPRGTGFLYVSDRVLQQNLAPLFLDMHGATWIDDYAIELERTAKRFELWEKPYALLLGCKVAAEYALEIGIGTIEERLTHLAAYLRKRLGEISGVRVLDKGQQLCAIVTIHIENYSPIFIKNELANRNINVSVSDKAAGLLDFRAKGVEGAVRLSPHYFNTEKEIKRVSEVIKELTNSHT